MITQEKMYDIFYNNQNYFDFVNSVHFKKLHSNEKVFKAMLSNANYATYLRKYNKQLNRKEILSELNKFDNKFWLKKRPLNMVLFIKAVKQNKTQANNVYLFFPTKTIITSLIDYLSILALHTKASKTKIDKIAMLIEERPADAINLIIKYKFN